MLYNGYEISVCACTIDDRDIVGDIYDDINDLEQEHPEADLSYVYVVTDPLTGEIPDEFDEFYDTVYDAVKAVKEAEPLDFDDDDDEGCDISCYELSLSDGSSLCILASVEPTVDEAREFLSDEIEDGVTIEGIEEIDYETAAETYCIDEGEMDVFCRGCNCCEYCNFGHTFYEVTDSESDSYCIVGLSEPTCEEAAEFLSQVIPEGRTVESVEAISPFKAHEEYGFNDVSEYSIFERPDDFEFLGGSDDDFVNGFAYEDDDDDDDSDEEDEFIFYEGDRVVVRGTAEELGIEGYDCEVDTYGTVAEDVLSCDETVKVTLDEINEQKAITVSVFSSMVDIE